MIGVVNPQQHNRYLSKVVPDMVEGMRLEMFHKLGEIESCEFYNKAEGLWEERILPKLKRSYSEKEIEGFYKDWNFRITKSFLFVMVGKSYFNLITFLTTYMFVYTKIFLMEIISST